MGAMEEMKAMEEAIQMKAMEEAIQMMKAMEEEKDTMDTDPRYLTNAVLLAACLDVHLSWTESPGLQAQIPAPTEGAFMKSSLNLGDKEEILQFLQVASTTEIWGCTGCVKRRANTPQWPPSPGTRSNLC